MKFIPKSYYNPNDYDNFAYNAKIQSVLVLFMLAVLIIELVLLPNWGTGDGKIEGDADILCVLATTILFAWSVALHASYTESHRVLCKAVAYRQLTLMGSIDLSIEIRTPQDIRLYFNGIPYDVAEKIIKGDYDNLLTHKVTLAYIH